jgi:hypothetical protein
MEAKESLKGKVNGIIPADYTLSVKFPLGGIRLHLEALPNYSRGLAGRRGSRLLHGLIRQTTAARMDEYHWQNFQSGATTPIHPH